ncbi:hypothetical protein AYI69_g10753 [Smittium culicis]|uniref:Uncharacterized protein n=1 Tax=Smittium culicis TaxID=133412 RepID=A0A1R1X3P8_9FUNG|nr:hypothetical protein AYI69_g10753 [Smittium culicis]
MELMPSEKHAPSGHLGSASNESCGCTEPTYRADGMVNFRPCVIQGIGIIRPHDVDLFASRVNTKLAKHYRWFAENGAVGQNGLLIRFPDWINH